MKTSKLSILALALFSVFLIACGGGEAPAAEEVVEQPVVEEMTVTVDPAASQVMWKGKMLGIKEHYGNIALANGTVTVEGDMVKGGSFTVDMKTMAPQDENYNEEQTPTMLIGHLSSPDFFAVDSFPTASFEIRGVEGNKAMGALTVRGVTSDETVENITVSEADGKVTVKGNLTFDRQKYGVSWASPMKEAVLSDDIELEVTLVANK